MDVTNQLPLASRVFVDHALILKRDQRGEKNNLESQHEMISLKNGPFINLVGSYSFDYKYCLMWNYHNLAYMLLLTWQRSLTLLFVRVRHVALHTTKVQLLYSKP